jgi:hypothetical protein
VPGTAAALGGVSETVKKVFFSDCINAAEASRCVGLSEFANAG